MQQGAAAVLYYGERFYEFPVGIVGMAVAVAIFPLLSRHAARGDRRQLGADMTLGLRLVFCLSVPAGVGLMLLAEPIARLLLQSGQFRAGRHRPGGADDRLLRHRRVGVLRVAGGGPRVLRAGRLPPRRSAWPPGWSA